MEFEGVGVISIEVPQEKFKPFFRRKYRTAFRYKSLHSMQVSVSFSTFSDLNIQLVLCFCNYFCQQLSRNASQHLGPVYTKRQRQCCNHPVMMLAILFSLKSMEMLETGLQTHSGASLQSCCSVDVDAWCKRAHYKGFVVLYIVVCLCEQELKCRYR